MKIDQDHLYYGAAILQIAEHPSFTAINTFQKGTKNIRCAYWVNNNIGVYLRYRTESRVENWSGSQMDEYDFQIDAEPIKHLRNMAKSSERLFLGLVCVDDREICCLSLQEFNNLVDRRKANKGSDEDSYVINVALLSGGKFRVYVKPAGRRKTTLGNPILVARRDFPNKLFA